MTDTRKLAGVAGIAFVILTVAQFLLPGEPPAIDAADSEILEYLVDNKDGILIATWLGFLGLLPAFLFAAYLVNMFHRAEGESPFLATATLFGFAFVAVVATLVAAVFAAAAFETNYGLDEANARLVYDIAALGTSAQLAGMGAFGLFSGWAILRTGTLPSWAGWLGVLAGALGVAGSAFLASSGSLSPFSPLGILPPFAGFLIYILAVSVLFLRPAKTAN